MNSLRQNEFVMAFDAESPDTWRIDLNQIRPEIFQHCGPKQGQHENGPGLLRAGTGAVNCRLGAWELQPGATPPGIVGSNRRRRLSGS